VYPVDKQIISITSSALEIRAPITKADELGSPEHSRFQVFWNDKKYDQTASFNSKLFPKTSGLSKSDPLILTPRSDSTNPEWSCNLIQTTKSGAGTYRFVADPRQNQISNYTWRVLAYTNPNLRWNGKSTLGEGSPVTQNFEETWINRDAMRGLRDGNSPAGAASDPTTAASDYDEPSDSLNAPFYIKNNKMSSVAELGHIFDPAHLDDNGKNDKTTAPPESHYGFGGGRTLRIGQQEFNYLTYNASGQRAIGLLDLFTANSSSNESRPAGINLNTAPIEVLTNFFYNIAQVSDEGQDDSGNPYALSLDGSKNIAEKIRDIRPYYSASDMWRFMESFTEGPNFNGTFPEISPTLPPDTPPTLDTLDRGREEIFRRAYNYMETKSAAFRFYGIGRALNKNGTIASQVVLEAQVELRADKDADGKPILRPVVVWKKNL
jgi:hypothetical protein